MAEKNFLIINFAQRAIDLWSKIKSMNKGISLILVLVLGLLIAGGIILGLKSQANKNEDTKQKPTDTVQATPIIQTTTQPSSTVPLPTEEDIIRAFFNLINEKRIPEAITMMSKTMAADDSTKQAWGVHFNAIKSINIQQIEPSMQESWNNY